MTIPVLAVISRRCGVIAGILALAVGAGTAHAQQAAQAHKPQTKVTKRAAKTSAQAQKARTGQPGAPASPTDGRGMGQVGRREPAGLSVSGGQNDTTGRSGQAGGVRLGSQGRALGPGAPGGPGARPGGFGPGGPSAGPPGPGVFSFSGRGGSTGLAGTAPSPGGLISMDFRGSDINNVLKFYAMATGWQIVPDPTLTGPVTIVSPRMITVQQGFDVLQSVLEVRGFTGLLERRGDIQVLRIVPMDRAVQTSRNIYAPPLLDASGHPIPGTGVGDQSDMRNQVVTEVIPVDNSDSTALAKDLKDLIDPKASLVASAGNNSLIVTDTASGVERIRQLVSMLDKASGNSDIKMIKLFHADANEVATAITNLFGKVSPRAGGAGQPGGRPGQPPPGQPGQPVQEAAREAVTASADTRTNSVLVVASAPNMLRVEELVKQLDDPEATALQTYVRKVKDADAQDVANTINSILSGTVPQSNNNNGGASFNRRVFGGFFGGQQNQQQEAVASTDPFAKVVANERTNSLYITATREKMARIDTLLDELDVPIRVESTTFVFPLKNAQAADMAYILGQAFGTGQQQNNGFGGFGGFFGGGFGGFGGGSNRPQPIQRRLAATNGRSAALGATRGAPMDASNQSEGITQNGIHGIMTQGGFMPDAQDPNSGEASTRAAGGAAGQYYGYGGYGQQSNFSTPQYGRGSNGGFVNYLQLRNQVGVVADPGSNSLIITTSPENVPSLQKILSDLDIMPRQVSIEVIIAEATVDAAQKLGFQFDATGIGRIFGNNVTLGGSSNFPTSGTGTTAANIGAPVTPGVQFGVSAANGQFSALVQALNSNDKIKILSTPRVFTSNNEEARINITTQLQIPTGSFSGGFGGGTTIGYAPQDVGVQLDVTPRITQDGLVTIDVVATSSELLGFDTLTSSIDANGRVTAIQSPRIANRSTDTSVSVRDGEIVALGGLMQDNTTHTVNKVPLLGDLPIVGALFRSTSTSHAKTELMIFMLPHVVSGDANNRTMVQSQSRDILKAFPELGKEHPVLNGATSPKVELTQPKPSGPAVTNPQ